MKHKLTAAQLQRLLAAAAAARRHAHAPYSKFRVGAALLAASGKIYTGVNVENASYGLTICAERVAAGNAVTAGERRIIAVAVVADGAPSPCGACRQVLAEFGDSIVVCADPRKPGAARLEQLGDLLPHAFRL
jgi:cytidine deaminase